LVRVALKDNKIAIVGSVIADYYTKKIVFTNAKIDRKLKMESRIDYLNLNKDWWETEGVSGASMMFKAEDILKYSLFWMKTCFFIAMKWICVYEQKEVG